MNEIKVICPKCRGINTVVDFGLIHHVMHEKCTKCGLCFTKLCPSGCITLDSDNFPQFNEKLCISCNSCVNLCPELAIVGRGKNKHAYTVNKDYILKFDKMI